MFDPDQIKPVCVAEALAAARETRALEIGSGILRQTPDLFRRIFGDRSAVIVADKNTFAVAGREVERAFRDAGHTCLPAFIFSDPKLYAESSYVVELEDSLRKHDAIPIAVGSGAINDLTKLAAHRVDRPYLCVATAASMDGYTAFGASITHQGSKRTFSCPAPAAVLADLAVIRAAPSLMTASGYADLLAKITAGADWLVADALGIESIDVHAWEIVQGGLRHSLSDPAGARAGEENAIRLLMEGLMLGGFAMQWSRSSRPASGSEHQFSHLWDMQHHTHDGHAPSHGFKVGIGTLAVAALYEKILEQEFESLDVERCVERAPNKIENEQAIHELFHAGELRQKALEESHAKFMDREELRAQLLQLRAMLPGLRKHLRDQLMPAAELRRLLRAVGAPTEPEQIGISRARLRRSFRQALAIRRRFTVLDLAERTGTLEPALDSLFGPGGHWAITG